MTTPSTATSAAKSGKRKWLRWLRNLLLVVIVLALLFRAFIHVLFPTILRKTLAAYDLTASYERLELSLLSGDAGLWHLKVTPRAGGDDVLSSDYCRLNISTSALFKGQLVIYRVEADGGAASIERAPDGSIPLLQKLLAFRSSTPAAQPAAASTPKDAINLESPFVIDAVRLSRLQLRLHDRSVTPELDTTVEANVRISDVRSKLRRTSLLVEVFANPVLDMLRIEGEGDDQPQQADAKLKVMLRGLHLKPAEGYLLPLGLRPIADNITGDLLVNVVAKAAPAPSRDVSVLLDVQNASLRADGVEALAMDSMKLSAPSITSAVLQLGTIMIEGARASAFRSPTGTVSIAGIEIAPATAVASPKSRPGVQPAQPTLLDFRFKLDECRIANAAVTLTDRAIATSDKLSLNVQNFSIRNLINDPSQPDAVTAIELAATAPGILKTITLDGSATPSSATRTLDLKLAVSGIKPDALAPYLQAMGLKSELKNGDFVMAIKGTLAAPSPDVVDASVSLTGIRFADGADLFTMDTVALSGLRYDSTANRVQIDSLELSGPQTGALRDAQGMISLLGLKTIPRAPDKKPQSVASSPQPAAATTPRSVPAVDLGKFTWKGISVAIDDQCLSPATRSTLSDAGVEISDVHFDPVATPDASRSGKIRAWLNLPGVADKLEVAGDIVPQADGLRADLTLAGKGITASSIAPYLKRAGVTPLLKSGAVDGQISLRLAQADQSLTASVGVQGFKYTDSGKELAAVDSLAVNGFKLTSGTIEVDSIMIARPRAVVAREPDGAFIAGGMRIVASTEPLTLPTFDFALATIGHLLVKDGSIVWNDRTASPAVNAKVDATIDLMSLSAKNGSAPGRLKVTAKVDGTVEEALVDGTLLLTPDAQQLNLDAKATGIRAGALAPYLPPGTTIDLKSGQLNASLAAGINRQPAGGRSINLQISKVDLHDGDSTLLKLGTFRASVDRLDPDNGVIAIKELSSSGIETDIHRRADGSVSALGLTVHANAAPAAPGVESAATQPAGAAPGSDLAAAKALAAEARKPAPLITLDKLDLRVDRITLHDESRPRAAPLSLAGLSVTNPARVELFGKDPESRPPVQLRAAGKIDPVVGNFNVAMQSTPFAVEPNLQVSVGASGISGAGLIALAPELAGKIDGSQLTDGRFAANLDSDWKIQKRGPLQFDLERGIDLKFRLKDVAFRQSADGAVLAGVEAVESDGVHIEPSSGEVKVKSLEVTKPMGSVVRESDGIHVLGLVIKLPKPGAVGTESQPSIAPTTQPVSEALAKTPVPAQKPGSEQRIDKLLVGGIDLRIEDRTVDPPLLIVLNGLDVEARDLSNMALYEPQPVRFSALVNAAKVPLLDGKTGQTSEREVFSQVTSSGKVSLYPALGGWVNTSVSGFDLMAARGEVKPTGLEIGGGVFDGTVNLRFIDDQTIDTRAKLSFTDLSLSEPPNGPVQSALKLPTPLDAVLGMLTDAQGAITLPVSVKIQQGEIKGVGGAAVGAVASVVTTAVASAPLKVVGGLGGLLGGAEKGKKPLQPMDVSFAPGDSGLSSTGKDGFEPVLDELRRDKSVELVLRHELGGGDLRRASQRANPSSDDALALAYRLTNRKALLERERADLAGQVRAEFASHSPETVGPTLLKLRDLDRQINQTDDALDAVYDLLKPGADRQASRRTRAASLEIAQSRLDAVREALLTSGVANIEQRVRISNPQFKDVTGEEGGKVEIAPVRAKKP